MSLNTFMEELITRNEVGSGKVMIVDDNAQLSLEHRLKNSESFSSMGSGRQMCRWSSQPSMYSKRTSSMSGHPSMRFGNSPKISSYRKNASWDSPSDSTSPDSTIAPAFRQRPMAPPSRTSSMPIVGRLPKKPQRYKSPHMLSPTGNAEFKQQNKLSQSHASSGGLSSSGLSNALGSMAPSRTKSASSAEGIRRALGSLNPKPKRFSSYNSSAPSLKNNTRKSSSSTSLNQK